jgi:hypothetical protein
MKVQSQKRATNQHIRGVEFPAQCHESRQKYIASMIEKYGAPYRGQGTLLKDGTYDILDNQDALEKLTHSREMSTFDIGKMLNVSQATVSRYMTKHDVSPRLKSSSSFQQEVVSFIKSIYKGKIKLNDRNIIKPKEIDIYIPSLKLGIETNGLYWHSEHNGKKSKQYHLSKTKCANQQNIHLIHIFESDWIHHQVAVKSRIQSALNANEKVYARNTTITPLTSKDAKNFYDLYHTQGSVASKYHYGLMHKNELVACISFTPSRFSRKYQYELTRFCSQQGKTIIGGASKLLKHFICTHSPKNIVSYCDLRWGTGKMYEQLHFTYSHTSAPNYWYFEGNYLMSRIQFQKHKLCKKLEIFDPSLSEWENMKNNKYDRIWDCGNSVWVFTN